VTGSWVEGADGSGFGIENLPYGVVRPRAGGARPAVRIGDRALDLARLAAEGLLELPAGTFEATTLNRYLALGPAAWSATRARLTELLAAGSGAAAPVAGALLPLAELETLLPIDVGDYVDFYSSLEHATNVGRIFRPGSEPLPPNWRHLPVGYHGRAGTVVVSGTPVRRPSGQRAPERAGDAPGFGRERRLDIEIELGFFTGPGPALGTAIPVGAAAEHIFGFVLVNDWSAREIQRWEYQPLGPFLGKSFATSISPWIVPLAAVGELRVAGPVQRPEPPAYLRSDARWALDVELCAELNGTQIAVTNGKHLYWSAAQQLAHATVNGATIAPGDLFASGTISGPGPGERGSLLELTWDGRDPLVLDDGTQRTFLEDGDTVVIRGHGGRIAFGEVSGRVTQ
jgi:fumarylacetoacetase